MIRNKFDVSNIFYDSELGVRIAHTGLMKKGIAHLGERENNRISGSKSSHDESSWCSKEWTEGAITIEWGSLLSNFSFRENSDFCLSTEIRLVTLQAWRNNKEAWVQTQSSREHYVCAH